MGLIYQGENQHLQKKGGDLGWRKLSGKKPINKGFSITLYAVSIVSDDYFSFSAMINGFASFS
jgi:hypothetical protein